MCVGLLLSSCGTLGAWQSAADDESRKTEVVAEPGDYIPPYTQLLENGPSIPWEVTEVSDFKLLDQTGAEVTKQSLLGKPWVASFVFARCPHQCPLNCKALMELNKQVQKVDLHILTITVDPKHDDVGIMAEMAKIYQAQPDRWKFCTGDPDEVWNLIQKGFKVSAWEQVGAPQGMEFAHSNHLIHVGPDGKIIGRYNAASELEVGTLVQVLKGNLETPLKHRPAQIALMEEQKEERLAEAEEARRLDAGDPLDKLPDWAKRLPATNAMLNGLATVLLLTGFIAIKAGRRQLHKQLMLTAFLVSTVFLGCYLTYHGALSTYTDSHGKPFSGTGSIRTLYYGILLSHVVLAAVVPIGTIGCLWHGFRENWKTHRIWGVVTFPIWLYVSVTGVIIYWMLYRM